MAISKRTVNRIAENAKMASNVWKTVENKLDEKFKECFHIRPTGSGVTIVSTLPVAPMRGIRDIKCFDNLQKTILELNNKIKVLVCTDHKKILQVLEGFGFNERKIDESKQRPALEEDVQAKFIRGMITKQYVYDNINFVASELILEDGGKRFDVVGFKDGTLYIFELKKGRKIGAFRQVAEYAKMVGDNRDHFLQVLKSYPIFPVNDFNEVTSIAVVQYAANSTSILKKEAEKEKVGLWFFEESLSFRKSK